MLTYVKHWPERKVPKFGYLTLNMIQMTSGLQLKSLNNLNRLVKAGRVDTLDYRRTPWGVMKFLVAENNLPRMMSIQNVYSLVNRVFDVASRGNKEQCGKRALQLGRLGGKYIGNKDHQMLGMQYGKIWQTREKRGGYRIMFLITRKYGGTINFSSVNDRPFVTSNIIGQLAWSNKENIDSIDITCPKN